MATPTKPEITSSRVRISKSGQITLPAKVREMLGVEIGDQVDIVADAKGTIRIESANPLSIEEFAGILGPPPGGETLAEYLSEVDSTPMVRRLYEERSEYDDRD